MSAPDEPEDDWLTTAEVAARVKRTPKTVIGWAKAGKLRVAGRLPDGGYLFDRAEVIAFVRGERPVKHATVDAAAVRAFVDASYRRTMAKRRA